MSENLGPSRLLPPVVYASYAFSQDAIASNQSAVAMKVIEVSNAVANDVIEFVAPWPGTIIDVSLNLNTAGGGGVLSVAPTINATAVTDPVASTTTGSNARDSAVRGRSTFVAGDLIGIKLTASNEWTGSTSDIVARVGVLYEISGV